MRQSTPRRVIRRLFLLLIGAGSLTLGTGATSLAATNTAPTFGVTHGLVTTAIGSGLDQANSVAIQPDDKVVVAGSAVVRYNSDFTLDATFSGDGIVTTTYGTGVAIQSDGKIVVVGSSGNVVRYTSDGSLDVTFDGDGITTASSGGAGPLYSVAVQSDGKIVAAGNGTYYSPLADRSSKDFLVLRFNSDGSPDSSFGIGGKVSTDVGVGNNDGANKILLQPDGKIVVVGWCSGIAVVRYNADGSLDTTFGVGGVVRTTIPGGSAYFNSNGLGGALQSDGKIVVAGGFPNLALARYTTNGSLDSGFADSGIFVGSVPANAGNDPSVGVAIQADGKIVVAGVESYRVMRFNSNGSIDSAFSGSSIPGNGRSICVQDDGRIVVAGESYNGSDNDIALKRYNADGSPDLSFSGSDSLDHDPTISEGQGVVLDANVTVFDAELAAAGNYGGATLTLQRHGGANPDDRFYGVSPGPLSTLSPGAYFSVDGVTIGRVVTKGGGKLVLEFETNATQALVDKAMRNLVYALVSDTPPPSVQIAWIFDDGNTGPQGDGGAMSGTGSITVKIIPVNDAPRVANSLVDQVTNLNSNFIYTIPGNAFTDPDGDSLSYSIAMANGTGVPPWLHFDAAARTFSVTAGTATGGNYDIRVTARDPSSLTASDTFRLSVGNVAGAATALTVPAADSDGAYVIGWAASPTAGVTYVLQEATSNTFSTGLRTAYSGLALSAPITGRSSGVTYYYRLKATLSGYTDSAWLIGGNGCSVTIPPASAVTLTPSVASPATTGATVLYSAAASGGSGNYQYKFLLRLPGGTLNTVRDYATTPTWSWNTIGLAAGTYQVVVHARNVGSTMNYETYQSISYGLAPPASAVTIAPSVASPASIGTTVTFTAGASGGSGKYEYKFLLRLPGGALNTVRDYSTTANWSWDTTGLAVGTYQVVVHARNVGSAKSYETYQSLSYGLAYPAASSVTLTPSPVSPALIGATVTLTAAASGGSGNYEYMFLLRPPGGILNTVRDYSTTASWNLNTTGLAAGTYQVVVRARNVGSTKSYEAYQSISYVLEAL